MMVSSPRMTREEKLEFNDGLFLAKMELEEENCNNIKMEFDMLNLGEM